jgi:hypothetical protein
MPPGGRTLSAIVDEETADRFAAWCFLHHKGRAEALRELIQAFVDQYAHDEVIDRALRARRRSQLGIKAVG